MYRSGLSEITEVSATVATSAGLTAGDVDVAVAVAAGGVLVGAAVGGATVGATVSVGAGDVLVGAAVGGATVGVTAADVLHARVIKMHVNAMRHCMVLFIFVSLL
jgi:hypothetical protein